MLDKHNIAIINYFIAENSDSTEEWTAKWIMDLKESEMQHSIQVVEA